MATSPRSGTSSARVSKPSPPAKKPAAKAQPAKTAKAPPRPAAKASPAKSPKAAVAKPAAKAVAKKAAPVAAKAASKPAARPATKPPAAPSKAAKPVPKPVPTPAPKAAAKPVPKPPAAVPAAARPEAPLTKAATSPVTSNKAPLADKSPPKAPASKPAEAPAAAAPASPRPTIIVAAPPNMPVRGNNPMSPRPPVGRPNMPPSFAVRSPGRPGFAEGQAPTPRPPAAKIELKAGDHVVYPTHGVGTVQGIETIEAAGMELQMIVVTFDENRMTLRVPVNKVPTAGLRKLFTQKEFDAAIDTLKGRARIKRTMWSRRAQEYEAKINSGDPIQIAEVVRDLQRNAGQPDQSFSERQIYEQALERLAAEYAAIEKIDKLTASDRLVAFAKAS
ncbi:CarD family transcriptional regulator [Roseococcus sp. XZZS9]|uniref:CarD family transcriptional regulator n=2 Tax=Roseococcus pinisoli TaxID=2835040 RepID=A0ABS5QA87_9PROT|nr:CarD family transcriptional regulator [Roseococcus pinisoli]